MRIYNRTGPDTGISYGLGELLLFWFLVLVGAIPFIAFYLVVYLIAIGLGLLLAINGIVYHAVTGKDARVWVPGSDGGRSIEYWMEEKGWIRLPNRLMHTQNM